MSQEDFFDLFGGNFPSLFRSIGTGYQPRISADLGIPVPYNYYSNNDTGDVGLELALAGYSKDNITVDVEDDEIIVKVDKTENEDDITEEDLSDITYIKHGIKSRSFQFSLRVSNGWDLNNLRPSFVNGILKIEIPKSKIPTKTFKIK